MSSLGRGLAEPVDRQLVEKVAKVIVSNSSTTRARSVRRSRWPRHTRRCQEDDHRRLVTPAPPGATDRMLTTEDRPNAIAMTAGFMM